MEQTIGERRLAGKQTDEKEERRKMEKGKEEKAPQIHTITYSLYKIAKAHCELCRARPHLQGVLTKLTKTNKANKVLP